MIDNVEENGTYIVIAPGIAMPHARPEKGAKAIGLSIVTLDKPVKFGHPTNDPVSIVVGLCAVDHQTHLRALSELVDILGDKNKLNKIKNATSKDELMKIMEENNMLKIVTICGAGVGSSMMLRVFTQQILEKHNIEAEVECSDMGSVDPSNYDLLITTSDFADSLRNTDGTVIRIDNMMDKAYLEEQLLKHIN